VDVDKLVWRSVLNEAAPEALRPAPMGRAFRYQAHVAYPIRAERDRAEAKDRRWTEVILTDSPGVSKTGVSLFAKQEYAKLLMEDQNSRRPPEALKAAASVRLKSTGRQQAAHHDSHVAPGIIIGRKGAEIEKLKQTWRSDQADVFIDIQEVTSRARRPARAESIALSRKRVAFRRAMRRR